MALPKALANRAIVGPGLARIGESAEASQGRFPIGAPFAAGVAAFASRGSSMRRLFGRYGFKSGFVLRRIDRAAGCVNAFLLAAALGLGMLDLAYAIDRIVAVLPRQ
jgi:hypothetical protein